MRTITTTENLAAFCAAAKNEAYVTIDTEFLRERTYWSKLCLIQMALPGDDGDAVLIDPVEGADMSLEPLYDLFRHTATVKVFHAARQDLEIFFVEGNCFPTRCLIPKSPPWSAALVNRLAMKRWSAKSRITRWIKPAALPIGRAALSAMRKKPMRWPM
jgi:hypothetical protein